MIKLPCLIVVIRIRLSERRAKTFTCPIAVEEKYPRSPNNQLTPNERIIIPKSCRSTLRTERISSMLIYVFRKDASITSFSPSTIKRFGINPRVTKQRIVLTANKPNKTCRLPSQAGNIQMPYKWQTSLSYWYDPSSKKRSGVPYCYSLVLLSVSRFTNITKIPYKSIIFAKK